MRIRLCWVLLAVLIVVFYSGVSGIGRVIGLGGDLRTVLTPLAVLGVALAVLAAVTKMPALLKWFLVGTGASAVGIQLSILLHTVLFKIYPTEPVTYIMFFFVFTPAFTVGVIGSLIIGMVQIIRLLFGHRAR